MVNTKLVVELEKLFKKEPFNYENTNFQVEACFGSVRVNPDANTIESLENQVYDLQEEMLDKESEINMLNDYIEYCQNLLEQNEVDYD